MASRSGQKSRRGNVDDKSALIAIMHHRRRVMTAGLLRAKTGDRDILSENPTSLKIVNPDICAGCSNVDYVHL